MTQSIVQCTYRAHSLGLLWSSGWFAKHPSPSADHISRWRQKVRSNWAPVWVHHTVNITDPNSTQKCQKYTKKLKKPILHRYKQHCLKIPKTFFYIFVIKCIFSIELFIYTYRTFGKNNINHQNGANTIFYIYNCSAYCTYIQTLHSTAHNF